MRLAAGGLVSTGSRRLNTIVAEKASEVGDQDYGQLNKIIVDAAKSWNPSISPLAAAHASRKHD
jgi:hypothetical protein